MAVHFYITFIPIILVHSLNIFPVRMLYLVFHSLDNMPVRYKYKEQCDVSLCQVQLSYIFHSDQLLEEKSESCLEEALHIVFEYCKPLTASRLLGSCRKATSSQTNLLLLKSQLHPQTCMLFS